MKTKYCIVCGSIEQLQEHHFIPISLGGENEDNNIITLCTFHHNFIHKMEGKLNHSQLIKNVKKKRIKEGLFIGGYMPLGYKIEKIIGQFKSRTGAISDLRKLIYDYESTDYKILFDIMTLYKNPIKGYRKLSDYIFKKYNRKISAQQCFKVRIRELKQNFEYWKDKITFLEYKNPLWTNWGKKWHTN